MTDPISLTLRRWIEATPEELFKAWTEPQQLLKWWGPLGVTCVSAEVDLRAGGRYRIGNQMPSGELILITGIFERVSPPNELIYSWSIEGRQAPAERVIVRFEEEGRCTAVTVEHQRIPDIATRDQHEGGWIGCLDGLEKCASARPLRA